MNKSDLLSIDIRYWIIVILIIYIIYMHYKYVSPIINSVDNYKNTIRRLTVQEIEEPAKRKCRELVNKCFRKLKKDGRIIDDEEIEELNKEIKKQIGDAVASEKGFVFDELPDPDSK